MLPNGLELSCPAGAGGAKTTLAPAGEQDKPHAGSAEPPSQPLNSPCQRAAADNLSARPPSQPKVLVHFQGFSELLGSTAQESMVLRLSQVLRLRPAW